MFFIVFTISLINLVDIGLRSAHGRLHAVVLFGGLDFLA